MIQIHGFGPVLYTIYYYHVGAQSVFSGKKFEEFEGLF